MTEHQVHGPMRAKFDAVVSFANGGRICLEDFMLDWSSSSVDHDELEAAIVRGLDLLMVHEIQLTRVSVVEGEHKRWQRPRHDLTSQQGLEVIGPVSHGEVSLGCHPQAAALLELTGHAKSQVSLLTVYGVWNGEPILVLKSGGSAPAFARDVLIALRESGLQAVITDSRADSSILPFVYNPDFVNACSMALHTVSCSQDAAGGSWLIGIASIQDREGTL